MLKKFKLLFFIFMNLNSGFAHRVPSTLRLSYMESFLGELVIVQDDSTRARFLFFIIGIHYLFALFKKDVELKARSVGVKNINHFSVSNYMLNTIVGVFGGAYLGYYFKKFINSKYKNLINKKCIAKHKKSSENLL